MQFNRISMELPILIFEKSQLEINSTFWSRRFVFILANSAYSDEMLHDVTFHLIFNVFHCLQISRMKRVNDW